MFPNSIEETQMTIFKDGHITKQNIQQEHESNEHLQRTIDCQRRLNPTISLIFLIININENPETRVLIYDKRYQFKQTPTDEAKGGCNQKFEKIDFEIKSNGIIKLHIQK